MDRKPLYPYALALSTGAMLGVSGCASAPRPLPPGPALQCTAEPAAWAIGKAPTPDVLERIRADTGSQIVRLLHPDDVITMEYSGTRVNVKVNERNAIVGVTCG